MIDFNKLVHKLWKEKWNIVLKDDIFEIVDPERKAAYQSFLDKAIYKMKIQKVLIPLKSWAYIIPEEGDETLNEIDLIEKYYIKLLKRYITYFVGGEYYISGRKALEFHMKDFSIPENISIINRKINKRVKIGRYTIIFKTMSGKDAGKKINLYTKLEPFVWEMKIEGIPMKVSCLELSLIEASIIGVWEMWVDVDLLNRVIKKYSRVMKKEIFEQLSEYKFIMAFNRLKELSKGVDVELYNTFLEIVKKQGWLFIGEWLRWF